MSFILACVFIVIVIIINSSENLSTKFERDRSTNNGDLLSNRKNGNTDIAYALTNIHTNTNKQTNKHKHTHRPKLILSQYSIKGRVRMGLDPGGFFVQYNVY